MRYRKDLLVAGATGATIAAIGCALLMPKETPERAPERTAKSERTPPPQAVPKPAAVVTKSVAAAEMPPLLEPVSPPHIANRRTKPGKSMARREQRPPITAQKPDVAPNAPIVQQDSLIAQTAPAMPPAEAAASARQFTAQEARTALHDVGTNPEAEAVWIAAINDANLPASQRKDLIEDLNEEGFADPKHLTASDLPRIEKRISLIEELAPEAIDPTNAAAFQEAYKDLKNMRQQFEQAITGNHS